MRQNIRKEYERSESEEIINKVTQEQRYLLTVRKNLLMYNGFVSIINL